MSVDYYCDEVDRELSCSEQAALNLFRDLETGLVEIESRTPVGSKMPVSAEVLHHLMNGMDRLEQALVEIKVLERVPFGPDEEIDEDGGPLSVV
jgi:hypothetical protein